MELSDRARRFAANRAAGMGQRDAAAAAGFLTRSPNSLAVTASRLDADPRIQRLTFELRDRRLHGMSCKALNVLDEVMSDALCPPASRIAAAKIVLSAAGHTLEAKLAAVRHAEDDKKELSNLTLAELHEMVAGAELRLKQAQGQVIEAQTDPADSNGDDAEE